MTRLRQIIKSSAIPHTRKLLAADLRGLGLCAGMTLAVHSSLGNLGYVVGGAVSVILALEDVLEDQGTLAMPTHTLDLSDPADWENPPVPKDWHQCIRDSMPPFTADLSPTWEMGVIAELFRSQSGTVRSRHPQLSWAARGKHAEIITYGHSIAMGQGEGSPLARLYELGAYVLLLGVDFSVNTSFHLAEYRCKFAKQLRSQCSIPSETDGKVVWERHDSIISSDYDFARIGHDFSEKLDAVKIGRVGSAPALLFSQRESVDFAVEWMNQNRAPEIIGSQE